MCTARPTAWTSPPRPIFETATTATHGLLWLDPSDVAANVATLAVVGIKSSASYFTDEILQEVYKGGSQAT